MISYITEKYIVLYGSHQFEKYHKQEFSTIERAIKFAGEKSDVGYDISIKQVNAVKGWEDYLHADVKLTDEDIDEDYINYLCGRADYYGMDSLTEEEQHLISSRPLVD